MRDASWRGEARRDEVNDERTDVLTFGIFASHRATPVVSLIQLHSYRPGRAEFRLRATLVTDMTFIIEGDD